MNECFFCPPSSSFEGCKLSTWRNTTTFSEENCKLSRYFRRKNQIRKSQSIVLSIISQTSASFAPPLLCRPKVNHPTYKQLTAVKEKQKSELFHRSPLSSRDLRARFLPPEVLTCLISAPCLTSAQRVNLCPPPPRRCLTLMYRQQTSLFDRSLDTHIGTRPVSHTSHRITCH